MSDAHNRYDVIIVGGGPTGSTAALYAARHGLKTLLLDRETFPRDKICGDAISGKSMSILRDLGLVEEMCKLPGASVASITFGSPNYNEVNIKLKGGPQNGTPQGFVIRRTIFDEFLFRKAQEKCDRTIEGFTVTDLVQENGFVKGVRGKLGADGSEETFSSHIVLGADGFNSIVARKTGLYEHDPDHWVVALRCYYKNVGGLTDQIELHYIDEVIPGYFWIFPLEDGYANIGIGMLHTYIKKRNVNLKAALNSAINSEKFRDRFANAEAMEQPVGWNLPVGSKHRKIFGNGFMLLGDAASLIDPFTGEGIGNGMYSARLAVETAKTAIRQNDVGETVLASYDRTLWDAIGGELALSTKLQKLGRNRFLLNLVIDKAAGNPDVSDMIAGMIANEIPKKTLANPFFYLKLLFT